MGKVFKVLANFITLIFLIYKLDTYQSSAYDFIIYAITSLILFFVINRIIYKIEKRKSFWGLGIVLIFMVCLINYVKPIDKYIYIDNSKKNIYILERIQLFEFPSSRYAYRAYDLYNFEYLKNFTFDTNDYLSKNKMIEILNQKKRE